MKRLNACPVGFIAATVLALAIAGSPERAGAKTIVVGPADDVQAALDGASPGDKVKFQPGVYTRTPTGPDDDAVFTVNTDNLTLQGPTDAVIDATNFEYGLMVGGGPISPTGCPATAVAGFSIDGFTFRNAEDTGLRLTAVDGFSITGGVYLDNEEYGPFPVCSRNGVIARNFASGHNDAAIYVGDDDNVEVRNNVVIDSVIGIEIENSTNAVVRNNVTKGNTTGILVVVLPGLPMPFTDTVLIQSNVVTDNNRENTGGGTEAGLPVGTGILNVGGDNVTIRSNTITGNDTVGVALIGNLFAEFDSRIEPFVDGNVVRTNAILGNGTNPDPITPFSGDIVFVADAINPDTGFFAVDPDPFDNCFANNAFVTELVFASAAPGATLADFPCQ